MTTGFHSGATVAYFQRMAKFAKPAAIIRTYKARAPRNFPITIWRSVRGAVARSSMVPWRLSSAKRRMVSMGRMNRATTAMLRRTGEITRSFKDSLKPPPISICCAVCIE